MTNEQEPMNLEGFLQEVDLTQVGDAYDYLNQTYRLCVLIEGDDGMLYNTFIERNCRKERERAREYQHLEQIEDMLNRGIFIEDEKGMLHRKGPPSRVAVTVVRSSESTDDLPLYSAVSPYRIVRPGTRAESE